MKKSKLSIGLVTSFIATIALAGCSEVTKSNNAIVTFKDYNGEQVDVINDDFYQKYRNSTDGISKFYDQILEVLIRNEFQKENSDIKPNRNYSTILYEAKNQVKESKETAKKSASSNGTKYEDEWNKVLENNDVEDEKGLLEHFIYQMEKSDIEDWYFDNAELGTLTEQFVGFDKNEAAVQSDVPANYPYHVKHILVKVDSGTAFYDGFVNEAQAKRLYEVVDFLRDGNLSFGDVAKLRSEDPSASDGGEYGIVAAKLSNGAFQLVNEFQLGVYAYDTFLSGRGAGEKLTTVKNGLGITGQYKDSGKTIEEYYQEKFGLTEVPVSVFDDLNTYANVTKDENGNILSNGNNMIYPRNILWNKYLNHHDVFVISNAERINGTYTGEAAIAKNATAAELGTNNIDVNYTNFVDVPTAQDGNTGFRPVAALDANTNHKYLTDEQGRVIFGVRSTYGIHFMVIQKSALDAGLVDYYTTDTTKTGDTFINFIKDGEKADYTSRKNKVTEAIKGFDATYSYRLYDYLLSKNNVTFNATTENGVDVLAKVNTYISTLKEDNVYNREQQLNKIWEEYIEQLEVQYANRIPERMVPEGIVLGFKYGGDAFEKGGVCYYA